MDRGKLKIGIASVVALLLLPVGAAADPVRIGEGYIQIGSIGPDFVFSTDSGIDYSGEKESSAASQIMLEGFSGDVVNLSLSYSGSLSNFSEYAPDRVDMPARADFDFRAGDTTVPPLDEVMASVDGVYAFAPFSFMGSVTIFATLADALTNTNPIGQRDFFGSGTARARFNIQITNEGVRRPDLPLVSHSVIYQFELDPDVAPVPEPGTLALIAGGLAAAAARARRRRT